MAKTRWGKKRKTSQVEKGGGSGERSGDRVEHPVEDEVVGTRGEETPAAAEEVGDRGGEERKQSPPVGGTIDDDAGEKEGSPADDDEVSDGSPVTKKTGEESVSLGRSSEEEETETESEEEETEEGGEEKEETTVGAEDDGGVRRNEEPVMTVAEEVAEGSEGSSSRTVSDDGDDDGDDDDSTGGDGYAPLQPLSMYFAPSEYKKKIKLGTRCYIYEALKTLDELEHPLTAFERNWFEEHPQFKHIFHMSRERNHKVMGMWMLLLRTARLEKKKEAWFIVNGTPIRYGIKEHALISGLNCKNYPVNYNNAGGEAFMKRQFKGATVRYIDVKKKLEAMVPGERSRDRLKMAILFFLSSIVIAQTKTGDDATPVEPFFLRAVDDLQLCKTFPWGRLSFDHMLGSIQHTLAHFDGTVKGTLWPVPGFCIPLELLAFEAIPDLRHHFLEDCRGADETCPRMCKRRFKKSESKGFPLEKIYKALRTTMDIDSILTVRGEEQSLMANITEPEDDNDKHDVVVESWMKCIRNGITITIDEMYNEDVATRVEEEVAEDDADDLPAPAPNDLPATNEQPVSPSVAQLLEIINGMGAQITQLVEKVDGFEKRLQSLEGSAKETVRVCKTG